MKCSMGEDWLLEANRHSLQGLALRLLDFIPNTPALHIGWRVMEEMHMANEQEDQGNHAALSGTFVGWMGRCGRVRRARVGAGQHGASPHRLPSSP